MTGNGAHIELLQQEGAPAMLVSIVEQHDHRRRQTRRSRVAVRARARPSPPTRSTDSATAGIVLANVPGGGERR